MKKHNGIEPYGLLRECSELPSFLGDPVGRWWWWWEVVVRWETREPCGPASRLPVSDITAEQGARKEEEWKFGADGYEKEIGSCGHCAFGKGY